MTRPSDSAFVWAWLPDEAEPVVAGRINRVGGSYRFIYGKSYLARPDAISLYEPELPLGPGWIDPPEGLEMAGSLWDASPDSWGQRVIIARLTGKQGHDADAVNLDRLTFLLESGSNRIGSLDFQTSSTDYLAREDGTTLDELHGAALAFEKGELPPALAAALVHGTSVGGARPKVTLVDGDKHLIAKLSMSTDTYPMIKAEAASLELAHRVGIDVPGSRLVTSLGHEVLLIERFDRPGGRTRRMVVSGLTMLGYGDFLGARYSSYPELLEVLRQRSAHGEGLGRQLFERVVFNIAIGNIDDHARNHAAFWDGHHLELTPAYDLTPQPRSGTEARQAMDIGRDGNRASQFVVCIDAAHEYGLSRDEARDIVDHQITTIRESWDEVAEQSRLTKIEKDFLFGRQILNPYASYDLAARRRAAQQPITGASGAQGRAPRGVPTGSQFTPRQRPEADVTLDPREMS
ncbi:MAG: serine/threonine-protein kinase HipA [Pseudonocardiales bacterium]|jgi:serine/threonine-protein kinase HipA|nr:serine/threonine-protein kinase HipA [Pseudonocardiales bacterium]